MPSGLRGLAARLKERRITHGGSTGHSVRKAPEARTCASGTAALRLSHRVFTRQGWTLERAALHMTCLREKPHQSSPISSQSVRIKSNEKAL